jgi:cobalt/nickel transport system ATP-binding protein
MNIIEATNLSYTYHDGSKALDGLSLTVQAGETVAVLGPNGAGKTTLFTALCGLIKPEGEISIFGQPLKNGNLREIRARIGFLFQNPDDQLFMPTVYDDVAFGLRHPHPHTKLSDDEIAAKVGQALAAVGLSGFERRITHHLSIGEKKRATLATILVMEPELYILDEPTSNLDPRGRREFMELVQGLAGTKIIASHNLEMMRKVATRAVVMNKGRITADGPAKDIIADTALLEANGLI